MFAKPFIAMAAAALCVSAQQGVKAPQIPQKLRSEWDLSAAEVPKELGQVKAPPPVGDVNAWLADKDILWVGTGQGLMRLANANDPWERVQYFAGIRYLPDDLVISLAPDGQGGIWVRTKTGVSHVEFRRMPLLEKAQFFEQRLQERHDREGIVAESRLSAAGDLTTSRMLPTDKDLYWTGLYAAAECYRNAVTKSPEAAEAAGRSLDALERMEKATGIPGLLPRTIARKGEKPDDGGIWVAPAGSDLEWKADPGGEEMLGALYAYRTAFDLLNDAGRKGQAAEAVRRIVDHLLANGYKLVGPEGRPWSGNGRWDVDYLISAEGKSEAALRAVEALAFLRTAAVLTQDDKYNKEFQKLAWRLGYADMATRYLEFRGKEPADHSHELRAAIAFHLVMRELDDMRLSARLRDAFSQWWRSIEPQKKPFQTFVYQLANPDGTVDLASSAEVLARIPFDLVTWKVLNSNRRDVIMDNQKDEKGRRQAQTLLPPDERPIEKLNGNPFLVDGGDGGFYEDDGLAFLLPYWMGRQTGLLTE